MRNALTLILLARLMHNCNITTAYSRDPQPGQPPDFGDEKIIEGHSKQSPNADSKVRNWTSIEIVLSFSILVFGALIFGLQTFLMFRLKLDWNPVTILRFNGLTLIMTGALLLVTAGYSNQQIAPVMGLLGTVAGYSNQQMVPVLGLLGTVAGYLLGSDAQRTKSK